MDKIIRITCKGSGAMPLEDFKDFQGNLKTLSKEKFEAGKTSILKYGFSDPVAIWQDHQEILDGHQRIFIVRHLVEQEGYRVDGNIPYCEIYASSREEAAQKLLAVFNSRYGQITDDGLYEFINENEIDIQSMLDDGLDLDGLDMADFVDGWVKDDTFSTSGTDESEETKPQHLTQCPKCGFRW